MKHKKNPNLLKAVKTIFLWRLIYMVDGNKAAQSHFREVEIEATEEEIEDKVRDYMSRNPRRKYVESITKIGTKVITSLWWLLINIPLSFMIIALMFVI